MLQQHKKAASSYVPLTVDKKNNSSQQVEERKEPQHGSLVRLEGLAGDEEGD